MTAATSRARRRVRLAAVCVGAVVAGLVLLALFAHTPPVRRAVLRYVVATLADRYDLVVTADALDYNLARPRIALDRVTVATTAARDLPFLRAGRIEMSAPLSAVFGVFRIDRLRLDDVVVHVVRTAGGTNLPSGEADTAGEPAALRIGRLDVPLASLTYEDRVTGTTLTLPALAIDVGPTEGSVRLTGGGRIDGPELAVSIERLGGGAAFDGRAVHLTRMLVATPDAEVILDGALELLVATPRLSLHVDGRGDVQGVARSFGVDVPVEAAVAVEGTVSGPFDELAADLRAASGVVRWERIAATNVDLALRATADRLTIGRASADVAGGRLDGRGDLAFADGVTTALLSWSDVDVQTLIAMMTESPVRLAARADGSVRLRGAGSEVTGWLVDGDLRLSPLPSASSGVAIAGLSRFAIEDGAWRLDAGYDFAGIPTRAALSGRIVSPLPASSVVGSVTVPEIGVTAVLDALRRADMEIPPDLIDSGNVRAEVALSGTLQAPRAQLRGSGEFVSYGRSVSAELRADGTADIAAVDLRLDQAGSNEVRASGTASLVRERADLEITGRLSDLSALASGVAVTGALDVQLKAAGPFSDPHVSGTVSGSVGYDGVSVNGVDAQIEATRTSARADVSVPELAARAHAEVAFTGARRASLALNIDDGDLARLTRDLELPRPLRGRVTLAARADGPIDDWRSGAASIELADLDAMLGELPVALAAPGRVVYAANEIAVDSLEAEVGRLRVSIAGRLPASASSAAAPIPAGEALRVFVVGDVMDVTATARAAGVGELPPFEGRGQMALVARVTGSAERPDVAADLDLSDGEIALPDLPPAHSISIRAHLEGGLIAPFTATAEWQGSRAVASARIPLRALADYLPGGVIAALPPSSGPAMLDARVESITPAVLEPFLDAAAIEQIAGGVDASLHLEAATVAAEALRGELRLDRLDVRVAGLPITQRAPTRVVVGDGVARIAEWDWSGQGATLGVQGEVRLADGEAALLSAGRFDLRLLAPFLRDAGLTLTGTLAPRVALVGPITDPRIDGELALENGEIRMRDPQVVATALSAFAVLTPDRGRITSLAGVVNGGMLTGSGELSYGSGAPPSLRLTGSIAGMALELPEGLRSELDVDATVALSQVDDTTRGQITGTVTVVRSAYREPIGVVAGLLNALRTERIAAAAVSPDDLAANLALDVRVVTDSDIIVDNNIAQLELGGDLRIIGTVAAPALSGRATLREGGQLTLGTNVYTIQPDSTIDFANPVTIDPELNIRATTRAGGHDIEVTLSGTAETLEVSPVSLTDPFLDRTDVVSLLLTGRVYQDLPGAEAQVVGEQVIGYLSGDVLGAAGRALGLDTVRLGGPALSGVRRDPTAIATEADPTSRLTFGKSFGSKFDLTYSQSLRDGSAQTWIIDYHPIRPIDLRLVARDDNLRSYEFQHDISLGGPPRPEVARPPRPAEQEVVEVVVTGDMVVPEAQLRRQLRLEAGDTFDFADWQRDREYLEQTLRGAGHLEARVAAGRNQSDAGVTLTYDLASGPRTTLSISGYQPSADTRRALEAAWAQSVFDDFLAEEAADLVRAALAGEGYVEPQVSARVAGGDPKTLAITVEPGTRTTSRRVAITGASDTLLRDLETWLADTGRHAWRQPQETADALVAEARSRGYLRARVTTGPPRVEGNAAVLPLTIEAGPEFSVGTVTFAGARHLDDERLRGAAALAAGDRFDPTALELARRGIESEYRGEGFPSARATIETPAEPVGLSVPVTIRITEGPRQVLREIAVQGNRGTDEDVITRAIDLTPGEPLPADAWLTARSRLFDTGLFRRVDVTTETITDGSTAEERATRLVVTVEEWPLLRIRYGLQVAEERPVSSIEGRDLTPGLSVDATRRTLFGRAINLSVAGSYERRERAGRVVLNAPTLFGFPIESLFTGEASRETFADASFVTDRTGFSWEQRARIAQRIQLSYSYRLDRDHTYDTAPPNPLEPVFDVVAHVARLTGSAVYDSRNDPIDTQRGSLFSWNTEFAPEALGSEFLFVRHVGQAYHFRPWRRVVFASAARFGLASPLGGQELIPSELFYAGGDRTVRGVADDALGPRDVFGDPAGGRLLLVFNQEARVPIYRWLGGVGFVDAGNVYETRDAWRFADLVTSVGAGLRLTTPFALLRVDLARPVAGPTQARQFRWTFGIGQAF